MVIDFAKISIFSVFLYLIITHIFCVMIFSLVFLDFFDFLEKSDLEIRLDK